MHMKRITKKTMKKLEDLWYQILKVIMFIIKQWYDYSAVGIIIVFSVSDTGSLTLRKKKKESCLLTHTMYKTQFQLCCGLKCERTN